MYISNKSNNKDNKEYINLLNFNLSDYNKIVNQFIHIKSDCELFQPFDFIGKIKSVRPSKNKPNTYIISFDIYNINNKENISKNNIKYKNNYIIYKTINIDSSMYNLRYKLI